MKTAAAAVDSQLNEVCHEVNILVFLIILKRLNPAPHTLHSISSTISSISFRYVLKKEERGRFQPREDWLQGRMPKGRMFWPKEGMFPPKEECSNPKEECSGQRRRFQLREDSFDSKEECLAGTFFLGVKTVFSELEPSSLARTFFLWVRTFFFGWEHSFFGSEHSSFWLEHSSFFSGLEPSSSSSEYPTDFTCVWFLDWFHLGTTNSQVPHLN